MAVVSGATVAGAVWGGCILSELLAGDNKLQTRPMAELRIRSIVLLKPMAATDNGKVL